MGPVDKVEQRRPRRAAEDAVADPGAHQSAERDGPAPPVRQSDELPPGFSTGPRSYTAGLQPFTTSAATSMTFRIRPDPWYRTNAAKLALVVLGLATAVAAVVMLLWPSSTPQPQPQDATSSSAPTPSATPSQSAAPSPEPTPAPAPPGDLPPGDLPPGPPPPDASAEQMAPPAYYPRYDQPTKKPAIDVTRAPISVAPPIRAGDQNRSGHPR